MVRDHPSIGQIDVFVELNSHEFIVNLNHNAFQPSTNALVFFIIMIAQYLDHITYSIRLLCIGRRGKRKTSQFNLL